MDVQLSAMVTPKYAEDFTTLQNNTTDVTQHNISFADIMDQEGTSFFQMYYSPWRFASECVLAAISVICNVIALYLSKGHYYQHPAYHSFFKNMAVANALSSLMSWISNNTMFFFSSQLASIKEMCQMLVILLALNASSMTFGIASGVTIVGFGVIHYIGICWPLYYDRTFGQKRVYLMLAIIWILSLAFSCWPLIGHVVLVAKYGRCLPGNVESLTVTSSTVNMGLLCACYAGLAILCLRIYYEICQLQKRLKITLWCDDLQYEKKAWCTIVMLLTTMTIFVLPYSIMYLVSLNTSSTSALNEPVVMFYMMLLPYVKYATDPVIYGKRMLGLQEELSRRVSQVCCTNIMSRLHSSTSGSNGTKRAHIYHGVQTVV